MPTPTAFDGSIPIYQLPFGNSFSLVVEGRKGGGQDVGSSTFNYDPGDPTVRPDLQVIVSRPLGSNPTTAVCDNVAPMVGGVPAVNPPDFSFTQPISDAINDLGCRFVDGAGQPLGRTASSDACTVSSDGIFRFVCNTANSPGCTKGMTTIQFCGAIAPPFGFPTGDTLVTVLLRDRAGNLSLPGQMIIRVQQ
ncbi:MAG TPA: hypothetical protein VL403_09380 [Candidatus Kryptonia bacterium]|nr:hypothetical protein [Candidatus Kryptonia bacterium]